ncbi:hypothetical protein B0H67DRAFT_572298 [Lasiosphaeris hirsuta]|uniref:Uncharacterized protein n=1 Tax=Lasiosphaeris hirsuta TaxID=260670 RepID=A0AA40B236_9PEZI|nr:hypothetical protein B0H67DRAFT_572298 [Lasiosphaeris hirsuta]
MILKTFVSLSPSAAALSTASLSDATLHAASFKTAIYSSPHPIPRTLIPTHDIHTPLVHKNNNRRKQQLEN